MADWEKATLHGSPHLVLSVPGVGRASIKAIGDGDYLYETTLLGEEDQSVSHGPGGVTSSLSKAMEKAEGILAEEAGSYETLSDL